MKLLTVMLPGSGSCRDACYMLIDLSKQEIKDIVDESNRVFKHPENSLNVHEVLINFKSYTLFDMDKVFDIEFSVQDLDTLDRCMFVDVGDSFECNDESKFWQCFLGTMVMNNYGIHFQIHEHLASPEWYTNSISYGELSRDL